VWISHTIFFSSTMQYTSRLKLCKRRRNVWFPFEIRLLLFQMMFEKKRYFITSLRGAENYYYKILSNYKKNLRDFATPFFINDTAALKLTYALWRWGKKERFLTSTKSTNDFLIASKRYKFRKTPFNNNWHYECGVHMLKMSQPSKEPSELISRLMKVVCDLVKKLN
jgi:hypothetical protein